MKKKISRTKQRGIGYTFLLILLGVVLYIFTPAGTLHSPQMRIIVSALGIAILLLEYIIREGIITKDFKILTVIGLLPLIMSVGIFIGNIFNGHVFQAEKYSTLINVEERDFKEEFPKIDTKQIPMMDRDTAIRLGSRQIGSMDELVSQFVPSAAYTQINIDNHPYRVTPLEYASMIRWFTNRQEGIPAYLLVDMVSGEVEVVEVEGGMKYTHSERLGRNIQRHLRKRFPRMIFREPSFEVDDHGNPYYVATTYENIFFYRQLEPNGVITLDAVTGETQAHSMENIPSWIDRVYSSDLIISQLNLYGSYQDGFWNSKFGKRGVTSTTEGYNYIPMGDDIYLYTGVTSVNSDSSNIGFYLVNLRTKDASFYPITSADEISAMESAVGTVQHMRFTSTFPLLINLNDKPFYISSLKDDSGLVRSYALVDAQDYQKVLIDETVDGLIAQFNGENPSRELEVAQTEEELIDFVGTVENISQAVVSGNTIYYFLIDGSVYKANINLHDSLPFVEPGNEVKGKVNEQNEFKAMSLD